ncbi:MAG: hypothetical protein Q9169_001921 [Polycauliona sp. 2 TL-2023]
MSFGWSATDIALLVQLAYKTTQGARAACGKYDELSQETSSLHTVLNCLHFKVTKPVSSMNRQASYGRELESIATGCKEVLSQLDKILVKYNALSEQERSARRLWKKIRFTGGVVVDVAELRSRVTYYTSALSLFLNLVSVGTLGAVETKMDQAGGDLQDIKAAVNRITASLLATGRQEDSVLTTYTNDDKDAWRELRRGLHQAGFRDSVVRKHMNTIMAYVKELNDKGVLEVGTDEASPQAQNAPTAPDPYPIKDDDMVMNNGIKDSVFNDPTPRGTSTKTKSSRSKSKQDTKKQNASATPDPYPIDGDDTAMVTGVDDPVFDPPTPNGKLPKAGSSRRRPKRNTKPASGPSDATVETVMVD